MPTWFAMSSISPSPGTPCAEAPKVWKEEDIFDEDEEEDAWWWKEEVICDDAAIFDDDDISTAPADDDCWKDVVDDLRALLDATAVCFMATGGCGGGGTGDIMPGDPVVEATEGDRSSAKVTRRARLSPSSGESTRSWSLRSTEEARWRKVIIIIILINTIIIIIIITWRKVSFLVLTKPVLTLPKPRPWTSSDRRDTTPFTTFDPATE